MTPTVRLEPNLFPADQWREATKTRLLKAKPLADIFADKTMTAKFLLDTLEGTQALTADSMVCVGIGNDAWQQTRANLLKKYTVTEITEDGWLVCTPKPENRVLCIEITEALATAQHPPETPEDVFYEITGLWGRKVGELFIQDCAINDFIVRRPDDKTDRWVVRRKMFLATYEILTPAPESQPAPVRKIILHK